MSRRRNLQQERAAEYARQASSLQRGAELLLSSNYPHPGELDRCIETWLVPEIEVVDPTVVVCLGGVSWNRVLRAGPAWGWGVPRPRPRFAHGAEVDLDGGPRLLGSYHPSQQNTFTGKLTEEMFDQVWERAAKLAAV